MTERSAAEVASLSETPVVTRSLRYVCRRIGELSSRQIGKNTVAGGAAAVAGLLVAAVSYPMSLHYLGAATFGLWLLLITPLTLVQINNMGLSPALAALVAREYSNNNKKGIAAYITNGLVLVACIGGAGAVLLWIGGGQLALLLRIPATQVPVFTRYAPLIGILVTYALIVEVFNAALAGAQRFDLAVRNSIVAQSTALGAMLVLYRCGFRLSSVLISSAISYALMHALTMRALKRLGLLRMQASLDFERMRDLLAYGNTVVITSLLAVALPPINRFVLSRYGTLSAVSMLELAFLPAARLRSVIDYSLRPYFLRISYLAGLGVGRGSEDGGRLESRVLVLFFFASLVLFGTGVVVAKPALHLWLGAAFNPALVTPFRLCLTGACMTSLFLSEFYVLLAHRRARLCIFISAILPVAHALVLASVIATRHAISPRSVAISVAVASAIQMMVLTGSTVRRRLCVHWGQK